MPIIGSPGLSVAWRERTILVATITFETMVATGMVQRKKQMGQLTVYCCVFFSVGQQRLPELVKKLRLKAKKRVQMENVSERLGIDIRMDKPSLLQHTTEKKEMQTFAFPRRMESTPSQC